MLMDIVNVHYVISSCVATPLSHVHGGVELIEEKEIMMIGEVDDRDPKRWVLDSRAVVKPDVDCSGRAVFHVIAAAFEACVQASSRQVFSPTAGALQRKENWFLLSSTWGPPENRNACGQQVAFKSECIRLTTPPPGTRQVPDFIRVGPTSMAARYAASRLTRGEAFCSAIRGGNKQQALDGAWNKDQPVSLHTATSASCGSSAEERRTDEQEDAVCVVRTLRLVDVVHTIGVRM
ncbi:hypothetical protein GUJ93_ZPchr0012g20207 [Zizania palustris]|uniref:Uncharacterized protein n=1 Tax=Zizania palustris TaxID=103762 RepID=A0A8J6BPM3_ZIZPA|nr:hypothetical protein GUJ93_ZPchr0012g20207 [Zizania palustris]